MWSHQNLEIQLQKFFIAFPLNSLYANSGGEKGHCLSAFFNHSTISDFQCAIAGSFSQVPMP